MKKVVLSVVIPLALSVSVGWTGQPNAMPFMPPTRCQPPAPVKRSATGFPEARGTATNAEVWALFFHPLTANRRVKIAWRMTGAGKFTAAAYSPLGTRIDPASGPVVHDSSNWTHDGDEWGTWFEFPTPGCWDLHVSRDGSAGDLWIDVK
jgi:hypothetical protein